MLEDIAIVTGGTAIFEELGIKLENVELAQLGRAKKVRIDKENCTIIEGIGDEKAIKGRIAALKSEIDNTTSDYDKEKLQERLAKLAGGRGPDQRRGRHRSRHEGEEGPRRGRPARLPGRRRRRHPARGGVAVIRAAAKVLNNVKTKAANEDQSLGVEIVRRAIEAPLKQIAENAGVDGAVIAQKVKESKAGQLRLQRPDPPVRRPDRNGRHCSHQGRAHRVTKRRQHQQPAADHGRDHQRDQRRQARTRRSSRRRRDGWHGRDVLIPAANPFC